jgi:hypothetical protein
VSSISHITPIWRREFLTGFATRGAMCSFSYMSDEQQRGWQKSARFSKRNSKPDDFFVAPSQGSFGYDFGVAPRTHHSFEFPNLARYVK